MKVEFRGNGGHAGNLKDVCRLLAHEIVPSSADKIIAFGAIDCQRLEIRYNPREGEKYPNLIHPSAIIGDECLLYDGIQIMARAVVQHHATIERFCIINTGAIIEHDAVIGKGCHIAPGAVILGDAKVGDFCFVGANAVVVQGSKIPSRTFVRAGSVWPVKNKMELYGV